MNSYSGPPVTLGNAAAAHVRVHRLVSRLPPPTPPAYSALLVNVTEICYSLSCRVALCMWTNRVNWINRVLLSMNIAIAALFIYLIFFRASYGRVPIEWSRTDAITIVLASLAVVLAALTIFLAVLAIWGYTGLREHATRMATEGKRPRFGQH